MEQLLEHVCVLICIVTKPQENKQALLKWIPFINFINDNNAVIEQWSAQLWLQKRSNSSGILL